MKKVFCILFLNLFFSYLFFPSKVVAAPYEPQSSLNSSTVYADGTTLYELISNIHTTPNFNHYSFSPLAGQAIAEHEAIINYPGGNVTTDGQYRGHFRWSFSGSGLSSSKIQCSCGNAGQCYPSTYPSTTSGYADVNPNAYGSQYVELVSCTVWANGVTGDNFDGPANHVAIWKFKAKPQWGSDGPFVGNTVSARGKDLNGSQSPWKCQSYVGGNCFNFNVINGTATSPNAPIVTNVTVNPSSIAANGLSLITITVYDPNGGNDIKSVYIRANQHGPSAGQYRGWLGWSDQGFPGWAPGDFDTNYSPNPTDCTGTVRTGGGGRAGVRKENPQGKIGTVNQGGWCGTSVSGNYRIIELYTFFAYSTPVDNMFSAWAMDTAGHATTWQPFASFKMVPPPSGTISLSSPTVKADGVTTYILNLKGTFSAGSDRINGIYATFNSGGSNQRGWLGWNTYNGSPCTNGGLVTSWVGIPHYTEKYINIINCTTRTSDIAREATFTISFKPAYLTPINNIISEDVGLSEGATFGQVAQTTFSLDQGATTTTISGVVGEGSICSSTTPFPTSGNTIYDTSASSNIVQISPTGSYSLSGVALQTPNPNTVCANVTPPSGYSYSLSCASSTTFGVNATPIPGTHCASVTGMTSAGVNLNLGFSKNLLGGWFQSLLGDVYIGNGFSLRIPTNPSSYQTSPYLVDMPSAGTSAVFSSGLVSSKGSGITVEAYDSSSRISNNSLRTGSSSKNLQVRGANFKFQRIIDFDASFAGVTTISGGDCSSFFNGSLRNGGVYKMDTACFSSAMSGGSKSYNFGGSTGVLYVNGSGSSTVSNNLTSLGNSRLVLLFKNDVLFASSLGSSVINPITPAHVQATIISNGSITFTPSVSSGSDTSIIVEGSVITYQDSKSIDFGRERGSNNATYPAELFKFNPKEFVDLTNLELGGTNTGLFINDVRWSSQ